MEIHPLAVPDAYRLTPDKITDERGCFYEVLRHEALLDEVGHSFTPRQVNFSVSRRGTLRGIHSVVIPPGQAKFVSCVRGAVLDIVVDIRLGSPTFGVYDTNLLDGDDAVSVYVAEGLGHGFLALTDDACVEYLCSTTFVPGTQFEIDALDAEMALPWLDHPMSTTVITRPLMSAKDANAPGLAQVAATGLLPTYTECLDLYAANRRAGRVTARI